MSRVFLLNEGGHNYDSAAKFGNPPFIPITTGRPNIFQIGELTLEVANVLKDFHHDDYLLMSGSPVLAAVAMAVLKDTYEHDTVNILIFHANTNEYVARRIDGFLPGPANA